MDATEALDVIEEATEITPKDLRILVSVGVLGGLVLGSVIGYKLADRKLKTKYELIAKQEIAEARAFFNAAAKKEMVPEQTQLAEAADALRTYQGEDGSSEDEETAEPTTKVEVNVFSEAATEIVVWDQEKEEEYRASIDVGVPYIIHHDEYMEAGTGYDQVTLTYYEGDETLADDKDEPVLTVIESIGNALEHFGHGSGDARTVFVRNDKLRLDMEIVKSDGKFAHEVLGLHHSEDTFGRNRQPRKFRATDD